MEIKFDPTKIKIVPIDQVRPNTWNPKEKKSEDYKKVLESIKVNGLMAPVFVREIDNDIYEIIDGEQRWTACEELGFNEILIYNYGKLSDEESMQKTIWWQQQVPFDEIKLAELFTDLLNKVSGDYNKIKLPYTEEEIKDKIEMLKFDWEQFQKNVIDIELEDIENREVRFNVGEEDYLKIKEIIENSNETGIKGKIDRCIRLKINNDNYKQLADRIEKLKKENKKDDEIFKDIFII